MNNLQYAIILRLLLDIYLNELAFGHIIHLFNFELVDVVKNELEHLALGLDHILYLHQIAITE